MKVRFYIPLNKATDILDYIQNEWFNYIDPEDIFVSQPLFITTIAIDVDYKTAKHFLSIIN